MRMNPPEAYAIGTIYRLWTRSHRTSSWECFGAALACLAQKMGGWPVLEQWLVDNLQIIPIRHAKLALADHRLHKFSTL